MVSFKQKKDGKGRRYYETAETFSSMKGGNGKKPPCKKRCCRRATHHRK